MLSIICFQFILLLFRDFVLCESVTHMSQLCNLCMGISRIYNLIFLFCSQMCSFLECHDKLLMFMVVCEKIRVSRSAH